MRNADGGVQWAPKINGRQGSAREWLSDDWKSRGNTGNSETFLRRRHFFDALELELGKAGEKAASMRPEIYLLLLLIMVILFQLPTRGIYSSILSGLAALSFLIFLFWNMLENQFQLDAFLTSAFRNAFQDNYLLFWITILILFGLSTLIVWTKDYRKLLKFALMSLQALSSCFSLSLLRSNVSKSQRMDDCLIVEGHSMKKRSFVTGCVRMAWYFLYMECCGSFHQGRNLIPAL